jgi:hypothetical protein
MEQLFQVPAEGPVAQTYAISLSFAMGHNP